MKRIGLFQIINSILLILSLVSCENIILTKRFVERTNEPEVVSVSEDNNEEDEINNGENNDDNNNDVNYGESDEEKNKYSINISKLNGNGIVSIFPDKEFYEEDEIVTLVANGNSGWKFSVWKNIESNEIIKDSEMCLVMDKNYNFEVDFLQREWTFFIYMAADNNLESAGIQDFNELEAVDMSSEPISIIVLLDRSEGYDSTNENWTGTRLYEIKSDENGINGKIISKQLSCEKLDLSTEYETELDMGNKNTLADFINFGKENYAANNYGLIIWGHGSGWRNSDSSLQNYKAVAIDETSSSYMTISELNNVLENKEINVLGFDVCFGSLIEIAYEFKNSVNYIIGSAGLVPVNGWNYNDLFSRFIYGRNYDEKYFVETVVNHFKIQYQLDETVGITALKMEYVKRLFDDFENFLERLCNYIDSVEKKEFILELINSEVEKYFCGTYPCDVFLDINSFCEVMYENIDIEWNNLFEEIKDSMNLVCKYGWSKNGNEKQLGIYFITMDYENEILPIFSNGYIKNSGDEFQSNFVKDSQWYVPEINGKKSFLDKLFSVKY